ncbi:MAG: transcriptional regulator, partial [Geminicoccaceae bacterium]|nr:transcriptional regulator [Geminicoccaceae bacterium]
MLPDVARGDEAMTSENGGVSTRSERIWLHYRRSDGNFTAWSCACGWHGTSRELNAAPEACVSSLRRRRVEATVTGEQIRRARELLGWTPYRLAPRAGIGHTLLRQFERGARPIDAESAARLRAALEEAGVEFLGNGTGEGVRLRVCNGAT